MAITNITDHAEQAIAKLATLYRGKPNVEKLIRAAVAEIQVVENALFSLIAGRALDTAVGVQLDKLGKLLGELRNARDDDTYRPWLRARIAVNRSSGGIEELYAIFALVLTTPAVPQIVERFPAAFELRIAGGPVESADVVTQLANMLQAAKAGGVKAEMLYTLSPPDEVMRFARTVAFLAIDIPAGAGTLGFSVNNVVGTFPADGSTVPIRLGFGANAEEFPGYDGFTDPFFSIDGYGEVANDHFIGEEVLLLPRRVGFGDASSPGGGGKMGGVA